MAKIFISHSSKDKTFVEKLAQDLMELGYEPWLDEWEIEVGDCIPSKIEHGIAGADYVIVVLSQNSVASKWVNREWKTKYWEEIETNRRMVLPIIIDNCEIPKLLSTKKYADFRRNYAVGFATLMSSISPVIKLSKVSDDLRSTKYSHEISVLLSKTQGRVCSLSQCMAEALEIAKKVTNKELIQFCKNELTGWSRENVDKYSGGTPTYRAMEVFLSIDRINLQYHGWTSITSMFDYMRRDQKNFVPHKMIAVEPLSMIEEKIERAKSIDPTKGILTYEHKLGEIVPETAHPNEPVYAYSKIDSLGHVLESIRLMLTKKLLELLPDV